MTFLVSMALINDDRLPGGQVVVLCHPDAEQETDNLGAVTRTRYVQRRGIGCSVFRL